MILGNSIERDLYRGIFESMYYKVQRAFSRRFYLSIWDVEQPLDLLLEGNI